MEKKICLLDTDIGDDIDDAFALALLLENPEIDLKAVTTVYKNTKLRAYQTRELLTTYNRNIDVYYGEGLPLTKYIVPFRTEHVHETGDLINNHPCQYDETMNGEIKPNAVDEIIKLAKEHQGELILVAIGPLTNIATAIQKEPRVATWVKALYTMGGWFTNYVPEWNILCDPVAADVVFKSGMNIYSCGLDVTLQCVLDGQLLENLEREETEKIKLLNKYFKRWNDYFHFEKSVMHDPLAITCITDNICLFEKKYVKVNLNEENKGAIIVKDAPTIGYSPINVATQVDKDRFNALVINRLFKKNNL